jgi:hypothetical protein
MGVSLIDFAKSSIEHFVNSCREQFRYVLVTCAEEQPKLGWRDPVTFLEEIKMLQANDLSILPAAIMRAFQFINRYRSFGAENFGRGRVPWWAQTCTVVVLTDGDTPSSIAGPQAWPSWRDLAPPSEFASAGPRWDQRLFTCVLQLSTLDGLPTRQCSPPSHTEGLGLLCEASGGALFAFSQVKQLKRVMTKLAEIASACVSISITLPDGRKVIKTLRQPRPGSWPMPENFTPDKDMHSLPPRFSLPEFSCGDPRAMDSLRPPELPGLHGLPMDVYELDLAFGPDCPLYTLLERANNSGLVVGGGNVALPLCVAFSRDQPAAEFGLLSLCLPSHDSASLITRPGVVYAAILPFAFLTLKSLLQEWAGSSSSARVHPGSGVVRPGTHTQMPPPSDGWLRRLQDYLQAVPGYYLSALTPALQRSRGVENTRNNPNKGSHTLGGLF